MADRFENWTMKMFLDQPTGSARYAMVFDIDAREVEMSTPPPSLGDDFYQAIEAMRRRDKRRKFIQKVAAMLATSMTDRLEDIEGWNGEVRQEKTRNGR